MTEKEKYNPLKHCWYYAPMTKFWLLDIWEIMRRELITLFYMSEKLRQLRAHIFEKKWTFEKVAYLLYSYYYSFSNWDELIEFIKWYEERMETRNNEKRM